MNPWKTLGHPEVDGSFKILARGCAYLLKDPAASRCGTLLINKLSLYTGNDKVPLCGKFCGMSDYRHFCEDFCISHVFQAVMTFS